MRTLLTPEETALVDDKVKDIDERLLDYVYAVEKKQLLRHSVGQMKKSAWGAGIVFFVLFFIFLADAAPVFQALYLGVMLGCAFLGKQSYLTLTSIAMISGVTKNPFAGWAVSWLKVARITVANIERGVPDEGERTLISLLLSCYYVYQAVSTVVAYHEKGHSLPRWPREIDTFITEYSVFIESGEVMFWKKPYRSMPAFWY